MRQRAMIAMALINDPKLLIADEPTTALDVTVQAQILELIDSLQQELNTAIVMITHDLGVVAEVAERVAVMYAGKIVEHGTVEQVFAEPKHPYTWGLLKSIPRLDTPRDVQLVPVGGRPPSLINRPSGCSFHPRCPFEHGPCTVTVPQLEGGEHAVACHLSPETKSTIWAALNSGSTPAEARAAGGLGAQEGVSS